MTHITDGAHRAIGTFESEKAENPVLARVLSHVYQGTYREPEPGSVPLREYAQRWLATRDLKPLSIDSYERLLHRWIPTPLPSRAVRSISTSARAPDLALSHEPSGNHLIHGAQGIGTVRPT